MERERREGRGEAFVTPLVSSGGRHHGLHILQDDGRNKKEKEWKRGKEEGDTSPS